MHYIGSDNRRNNSKSGLIEGGKLTTIARLLIPDSIHRKYNEEKEAEFLSDLEGVLPSYKIKTTRDNYDVDKIVERAKQKGEFSFYNKFHENPDFSEKYITADTEKEFREKIEKFVEYAKLQQNIKSPSKVTTAPTLNKRLTKRSCLTATSAGRITPAKHKSWRVAKARRWKRCKPASRRRRLTTCSRPSLHMQR